MIEPSSLTELSSSIRRSIEGDRNILDEMRMDVRALKSTTRRIHRRVATAISLVGTDGGNNQLYYDPFMVELVRVVDSSCNEYCLEAVTQNSDINELNSRHLTSAGAGKTPLGRMMVYLGISCLEELSGVFKADRRRRKASWTQVYREMSEWAVLFSLVKEAEFGTDTVIVRDGFLRSKMFSKDLFAKYREGLQEGIRRHFDKKRRRIYIVGVAKHSKVLQTYRLAMAIEDVLRNAYPCYAPVNRELEKKVYKWPEYARGDEEAGEGEINKFVAGKMFLAKFGGGPYDPVWAIDLLDSQADDAPTIFGYLLADAIDGFPIPFYPRCLQRAHENAALVEFDMDILQSEICNGLRDGLGEKKWIVDELALQEADPSRERYE